MDSWLFKKKKNHPFFLFLPSFPLHRWLNKLGLASIQYEPTVQNPAAGEHPPLFPADPSSVGCVGVLTFDLFLAQSVTVKPATTKKPKAQKSPLRPTRTRACRTPVVHRDLLVGHIRSATPGPPPPTRFLRQNGTREGVLSPFRGASLLLTPRPSRPLLTGRCPPPSAP